MNELVAKRYAKAIFSSYGEDVTAVLGVFKNSTSAFSMVKFRDMISSPALKKDEKLKIVLEIAQTKDAKMINLFKLLAEKNRLTEIPAIYTALSKLDSSKKRSYEGVIITGDPIDSQTESMVEGSLSAKLGVQIKLKQKVTDFDGVKVEVEELGVEAGFSRSRLKNDLIEHILKAI